MDRAEALVWKDLVSSARRDVGQFRALLGALDCILRGLARRLAGTDADDALQAAHIAIWQALPKVDLRRTRGIRAMLITTGVHAMRDERRRHRRQTRGQEMPGMDPTVIAEAQRHEPASSPRVRFTGLLGEYARYVRENGEFAGAHRHMARVRGTSLPKATGAFHRAAREFIAAEGLMPAKKRYQDIVERVLAGERVASRERQGPRD